MRGLTSSCLRARRERERAKMCREGKPEDGEEEGAEEDRKRKREGSIFICSITVIYPAVLACACVVGAVMARMGLNSALR